MKTFCIACILLIGGLSSPAQSATKNKGKILLAIFAHPDDEFSVAPVLAKYAAEGVQVYLAVATDGSLGTANTKIPPGDSLAAIRKTEIFCAAEKLGINSPILIGLSDQFKMVEGHAAFQKQIDTLKVRVRELFELLKPDVVITWSASGGTGHHDHRLVGSVVTEVFETRVWKKPAMLYYSSIPTQKMPPEQTLF